jgi:hypothetical protein
LKEENEEYILNLNNNLSLSFKLCVLSLGMSSACSNPLLYGWLNQNFRQEFKELFGVFHSFLTKCFTGKSGINNNNINKAQGRRPSHIYCGPATEFGENDDDDNHGILINGKTRETLIVATSINDIPLTVKYEY